MFLVEDYKPKIINYFNKTRNYHLILGKKTEYLVAEMWKVKIECLHRISVRTVKE
jgi:hypothetical protein